MSDRENNSNQSLDALLRELTEFCRSDSLSEDGLREIIERHGCALKNNDPNPNINNYDLLHWACGNEKVTEGIIRCLLEYFPNAVRHAGVRGRLPLHHIICWNKNVTLGMVQLLIDAYPDSLHHKSNSGCMPLHDLCGNENLNEVVGLDVLKLLIEKYPEALRHAATECDNLPLHLAAMKKSPDFCRILIEAYPGSEWLINGNIGALPLDIACQYNTVATVKYFYHLYPESINKKDSFGWLPIHSVIMGLENRSNPENGIEVIRFLLDHNMSAISSTGETPLHIACSIKNVTLGVFRVLIDAFPDSLRRENKNGYMPLHKLSCNKHEDEEVGLDVLKLFLERYPESVRHTTRKGNLPIHLAAGKQSPEFCRVLIEAYPGSERITRGMLPFHRACQSNTVDTAKYLCEIYPESINVADDFGCYPIHSAIWGLKHRTNPTNAVEIVQFLVDCNPDVVLQKFHGKLPLYWVCMEATNEHSRLKIVHILYDLYPEAIERDEVTSNVDSFCEEVKTFIRTQLIYARQARGHHLMHSSDEDGRLPLHKALRDNAILGSIKLLVKGNPSAICTFDNRGVIPLHVACQHHKTPAVVEYLIGLNEVTLTTVDREGNTTLHHACCGANYAIIALLLDKYGSVSVSNRNVHKQLPIDLLLQNKNEVSDNESLVYTESIYRLIRANPETLMHYDLGQAGSSEDCLSQKNNKKRKIDEVYEMCVIQ
jgi:ankyrin repeat protein